MSNRRLTQHALTSGAVLAQGYVPPLVAASKRALDVLAALALLAFTAPLWPLVALAIKVDSEGPVIYRQLRVGRALADQTSLFMILKFRSMVADAERHCGAVLARQGDARVTRVGRFLRLTRLDELPQLINVLKGDMSLVGPRPERPEFYRRLDRVAPFFADRTVGLRPGITGLAQVSQGYDCCDADVVRKLGYDAAYAMRLADFRGWIQADFAIMLRTFGVMVGARGQ